MSDYPRLRRFYQKRPRGNGLFQVFDQLEVLDVQTEAERQISSHAYLHLLEGYRIGNTYRLWFNEGKRSTAPHFVKQLEIKTFAQKYRIRVFIKTAPYLCGMVAEVSNYFVREYFPWVRQ